MTINQIKNLLKRDYKIRISQLDIVIEYFNNNRVWLHTSTQSFDVEIDTFSFKYYLRNGFYIFYHKFNIPYFFVRGIYDY